MNRINIHGKYKGKDAIVYDIDNTLLDVRERYWRSIEEAGGDPLKNIGKLNKNIKKKFWKIFLSSKYLYLDKPHKKTIKEVNRKFDDGYIIILITGRPEYMRDATIEQLKKYNVKYHILIMRPNNNHEPDYVYKPKALSGLVEKGLNILEYHEDDDKTINTLRRLYPEIKYYKHDVSREKFFFYEEC